ncbi:MAG: site-2 protease family protein [Candidatus Pacearchaeota archaeon]
MKFIYYDLIFLVLFSIIVSIFLYKNRKKLKIESKILLLYKTSFGLNFIEKTSSKAPGIFKILSVLSIVCGYFLMLGGIFLLLETIRLIWTSVIVPKVPPLMPLVPYLPNLFKIEFLPPFYFTYWIISIAIVAIGHEFMHGVFARFYKIKLKSTGFGFLGPFLAAFVELDEKIMEKKSVKAQLAVLSGGSFANLVIAILFFFILNLFFAVSFSQAGVIIPQLSIGEATIPSYIMVSANISEFTYQDNAINLTELKLENKTEFKLEREGENYYLTKEILSITPENSSVLIVYADTPAYRMKINGTIRKINGNEIKNMSDFQYILKEYKPGNNISLETTEGNYTFELAKDPANASRGIIGIGFPQETRKRILVSFFEKIMTKKDTFTYYAPKAYFTIFIYNLLLWILLINVSVMLINMLPFSIFDGGRFFYLTLLGLTGSRKKAIKGFKIVNTLILLIFVTLMFVWILKSF